MSKYESGDRTPYVYIIKFINPNTKEKKWYIGSRYCKGCHPKDLLSPYTTSSKTFNDLYSEHDRSCFTTKIVKVFSFKDNPIEYEKKLFHRAEKFGLKRCQQLINRAPPGVKASLNHSEDHRRKNSESQRGKRRKPCSEHTKNLLSEANRGQKPWCTGKHLSDSHKLSISKSYRFLDPNGVLHEFTGLSKFCKLHGLHAGNMSNLAKHKIQQCKGWTIAK